MSDIKDSQKKSSFEPGAGDKSEVPESGRAMAYGRRAERPVRSRAEAGDGGAGVPAVSGAGKLPDKEKEEKRRIVPEIKSWLRDLALAAVICILLIVFVAQPFRVEKTSMEPLLDDGDRILVSKISLLYEPIRRGEIIVLWNPRDPGESWIKRVVGLPGEKIRIEDGIVYINGKSLDENYILDADRNPPKNSFPSRNAEFLTHKFPRRMREYGMVLLDNSGLGSGKVSLLVPDGYYFVMGDHRRYSMDSRDSVFLAGESGPGVIPAKYIYGKAIFRYWPLNKFGPIPAAKYNSTEEE